MTESYKLGVQHFQNGYSIHYNPFRNKGRSQDYLDWAQGWMSQVKNDV